ncbi:hypothetical protein EYZ11_004735 [Aspergillus tanneri]|uniref:Uncharacterized protein n=1 Tax=Aspergillus tanneri TaxID=1220188 RepID=A0A4S3JK35_9EURO|nr:uncharacterized protein ATNIH1004_005925 [Aspergillus tanneri]KAA8647235.1 hypothetical protein ATNIH1004_005925 [Aspergillus tanneri]THC95782.1 hypothetical protein EYZ11_004735 [Aspergillus tanneri]
MAHATEELLDKPDGSSLIWIFDHCLRYPGTYEIPLRTMYALNCNPTRQPPPGTGPRETAFSNRTSNSSKCSTSSQDAPWGRDSDFRALLTHHMSLLQSQPCSLPPTFVTSFLRRCFTPELENVDFPQALTGLDYLKELEGRRKKEVAAALHRLEVQPEDLHKNSEFRKKYPGVVTWIEALSLKNRNMEALYTQIYIGLRRWTLINEMLMEPFNKANCIAMLNTLFPPLTDATVTPTSQLTPQILKSQRDGFFRYISAINNNAKVILNKVITQGAPEGSDNGWPLVRDTLDKYLRMANEIIDECLTVSGPASFDGLVDLDSFETVENVSSRGHKGRKVDSGISFGSSDIIPASSVTSSSNREDVLDKPLPPSPSRNSQLRLGGSTLERLAREIRKLSDAGKVKSLKKMRSTSTLGVRPENLPGKTVDHASFFEIDEQKRKRLIWEATSRKRPHSKQPSTDSFQE